MAQILGLIFKDKNLCNLLAFKGGTALMFFHGLPRFSTDLDFNLLDPAKADFVYDRVRGSLIEETASALELFSAFPLLSD